MRNLSEAGATVLLVTHNVIEAEKAVDRLALIDNGRVLASGTPSSLKLADRGRMRLQVMLVPGTGTPPLPGFVERHVRTSHTLVAVAVLLGVFTTTMLGYEIAHASSRPMVTLLLTRLFVLLAFGYAPINFPASQMPDWLVDINRALPLLPAATTVRDGLTHGLASGLALSYVVLAMWAVGSVCLAVLALRRRG